MSIDPVKDLINRTQGRDAHNANNNVDIMRRLTALETGKAHSTRPIVTALPTPPSDGSDTECYYQNAAMASLGVVWHLHYRALSGSSYKWEYVGGAAMLAEVTAIQNTGVGVTTYAALGTAGPQLTVPLAGEYHVEIGCYLYADADSRGVYMSYDIGGTGASDNDAVTAYTGATFDGLAPVASSQSRQRMKTLAASAALVSKYRASAGNATVGNRWMRLIPVRVG